VRDAEAVRRELAEARAELEDRRRVLPAHSVTPSQYAAVEELEDRVRELEQEWDALAPAAKT
jgi:hypothetical protein